MKMLQSFKRVFRKLTPAELAARELADAELSRLESQTGQEYAAAMCDYHAKRITRLRTFLRQANKEVEA